MNIIFHCLYNNQCNINILYSSLKLCNVTLLFVNNITYIFFLRLHKHIIKIWPFSSIIYCIHLLLTIIKVFIYLNLYTEITTRVSMHGGCTFFNSNVTLHLNSSPILKCFRCLSSLLQTTIVKNVTGSCVHASLSVLARKDGSSESKLISNVNVFSK